MPTKERDELIWGLGSIMTFVDAQKSVEEQLADFILADRAKQRADELRDFNPFVEDHSNCPDPFGTCIGYQNAYSDFENERDIRLAELAALSAQQPQGRDGDA